ncbi:MAG: type I pullulanase [Candidatus Izemoplasmatales bacterium]|nr:type I pullulanase [Candidatus Izemoplasmatales bacterium]
MNKRPFYCYLDNFDELTIIIPIKNYQDNLDYFLIGNEEIIKLKINQKINLGVEIKLIANFDAYIDLGKVYFVENTKKQMSELYTGKIVRTELFDNIYNYKKHDLGYTYSVESTKFKIWSPVAKYIKLELVDKENNVALYDVKYKISGVWRVVVEGDLDGYKYRYIIYVNGKEQTVLDPYGKASNANGKYNYIVDFSKTYQVKNKTNFSGNPLDAIIYETSVRDFTSDYSIAFKNKKKYLGFVEEGIKTTENLSAGIDYLKELGITHVQLMPIFDFEGIDELNPDSQYNWGYNPSQYFVPEGSYATDANDPYARINEVKKMIDKLHEKNISVVMDVVYNHVYDAINFSVEKLIPGYAYHVDRSGINTNVSGCNNDLATHRKMMRKLIIDATLFWASEYKIDGFRFDLMGLIDYETMNELAQELHDLNPKIIVYGEGWNMYSSNLADRMAHMASKKVIPTIGFFNDKFRETIKGSTFHPKEPGYTTGDLTDIEIVKEMLLGSARNRYMFKYPAQSINYVECHDNLTFYDKCLYMTDDLELIHQQQLLATSIVLLSQGVPFIHSGQEFYRTKDLDENSYISSDNVNKIDWSLRDKHESRIAFIRELIKIRKSHNCFKLKSSSDLDAKTEVVALNSGSLMVHFNDTCNLLLIFKPNDNQETIIIPEEYQLLISSEKFETIDTSQYQLNQIGTYIFKKGDE